MAEETSLVSLSPVSNQVVLTELKPSFHSKLCHNMISPNRSYSRSGDWVSEERLYRSGLRVCPLNAKVHYNVANVVAQLGSAQEAEERYREALRSD